MTCCIEGRSFPSYWMHVSKGTVYPFLEGRHDKDVGKRTGPPDVKLLTKKLQLQDVHWAGGKYCYQVVFFPFFAEERPPIVNFEPSWCQERGSHGLD
jgi:hypothetical protein